PRPSVQVASLGGSGMANLGPSPAPAVRLPPPEAEPRAQLRALFLTAALQSGAAPAAASAPVRVAVARTRTEGAPDGLVAEPAASVATRFSARSPGDDLATSHFSGSATQSVPGRF
ncbi:MAG TPA: peptidase domain containing protein, partial [Methylobacterium sp.]